MLILAYEICGCENVEPTEYVKSVLSHILRSLSLMQAVNTV